MPIRVTRADVRRRRTGATSRRFAGATRSESELSSEFHDAVRRDSEVRRCAARVLRHEDVELLAPPDEPRLRLVVHYQRLAPEIERRVHRFGDYSRRLRALENVRDIGSFHKAVARDDAPHPRAELVDVEAFFRKDLRNVRDI